MAIAWYFCSALTKEYNKTIKYIENKKLSTFVHNKTISKCADSKCFSLEIKTYLRSLRIK